MNSPNTFRVLVIDDNIAIHNDFRKMLGAHMNLFGSPIDEWSLEVDHDEEASDRFEVMCASQGDTGLELLKEAVADEQPIAMAFVDMKMPPGWDGLETVERLWEVDPQLQVVLMTAYTMYTREDFQERLGLSNKLLFVKKPFEIVEIQQFALALTQKWLEERQSTAKLRALEAELAALRESNPEMASRLNEAPMVLPAFIEELRPLLEAIVRDSTKLMDEGADNLSYEQSIQVLTIQQHILDVLARFAPLDANFRAAAVSALKNSIAPQQPE